MRVSTICSTVALRTAASAARRRRLGRLGVAGDRDAAVVQQAARTSGPQPRRGPRRVRRPATPWSAHSALTGVTMLPADVRRLPRRAGGRAREQRGVVAQPAPTSCRPSSSAAAVRRASVVRSARTTGGRSCARVVREVGVAAADQHDAVARADDPVANRVCGSIVDSAAKPSAAWSSTPGMNASRARRTRARRRGRVERREADVRPEHRRRRGPGRTAAEPGGVDVAGCPDGRVRASAGRVPVVQRRLGRDDVGRSAVAVADQPVEVAALPQDDAERHARAPARRRDDEAPRGPADPGSPLRRHMRQTIETPCARPQGARTPFNRRRQP